MKIVTLLTLATSALSAAEVAGNWSGVARHTSKYGDQVATKFQLTLTQSGQTVAGTLRRSNVPEALTNGQESNGAVTFQIRAAAGVTTFTLNLSGNKLGGQLVGDNGFRATVDLTKQ